MGHRQLQPRTAVVLVVDRLGAGFLGPFGNTWIDTPCLNELASRSLVVEQAWIDSPQLAGLYRSLWLGQHAAWDAVHPQQPLAEQLRRKAGASWLITDDPPLAGHPLHSSFDQVELLETDDGPRPKSQVEDTNLARLMSLATDVIVREQPALVWIHARGMQGAWDAPLELRDRFVEEGDADPPRSSAVPSRRIDASREQDELQGWIWAYAGQVLLLDSLLGMLLDALDALGEPPLFLMMGARGFPLGEHGGLGTAGDQLYSELLHVPLLLRFPGDSNSVRSQELVQPHQVFGTLVDWYRLSAGDHDGLACLRESPHAAFHPLALTVDENQWAMRTPAWLARLSGPAAAGARDPQKLRCELYLKPDDYWDANDVSDRCPEVVAAFQDLIVRLQVDAGVAGLSDLMPLDESLLTRIG